MVRAPRGGRVGPKARVGWSGAGLDAEGHRGPSILGATVPEGPGLCLPWAPSHFVGQADGAEGGPEGTPEGTGWPRDPSPVLGRPSGGGLGACLNPDTP